MVSVLRIKKEDGTWENIPAIKGEKGDKGIQGEQGVKGEDGYTPVKGVDYYTAAEKQELINEVIAALPLAEEVAY